MAICSLCQLEKGELHKESHIIPALFWRFIRKEEGEVKKFPYEDIKEGTVENGVVSREEYEHDILCSDCETLLNDHYEDYAAKRLDLLKKDQLGPKKQPVGKDYGEYVDFENVDAGRIKLFFLSILWRASIASTREICNEIALDPEKEERLREMIYNRDPGSDDEFSIAVHSFSGVFPSTSIFKPISLGKGLYLFVLTGFVIFFDTSGGHLSKEKVSGQENGLRIGKMTHEGVRLLFDQYPLLGKK